jgi:hypothetical protein
MKKFISILTVAAVLVCLQLTLMVQRAKADMPVPKTHLCYCTYYADGSSKIECKGAGSECGTIFDCSNCW